MAKILDTMPKIVHYVDGLSVETMAKTPDIVPKIVNYVDCQYSECLRY